MNLGDPIGYKCVNCGVCCGRLLLDRQGVRKGLPLLPDELGLFRREMVKPAYGVGEPGSKDFRVVGYQMTRMACPFHQRGGCTMWAYRPAVCRSYPFIPVICEGPRVVKTLDFACTALRDQAEEYQGKPVPLVEGCFVTESEAYERVKTIPEMMIRHLPEAWFYDLSTLKWMPFRTLLGGGSDRV